LYSFTASAERRLLWLLAFTQFTVIMDFMVMMPLGPQIMRAFDISPAAFATAVSAYSWCAGLSGLLASTYIDRYDRRSLLLTMYALFSLSNLVCALAGSFEVLLISRAFAGLTGGVMTSLIMAVVSDVIPPHRRGAATGIVMSAFSLAAVIGVPVGIALGAHFGWSTPFLLLFGLTLLIGLVAYRLVPSLTAHLSGALRPFSQALPDLLKLVAEPHYRPAFLLSFGLMIAHMMVIAFISPYLVANHGVAPASIAWMYCIGGVAPFFTSRLIGRLADRYGPRRVFRLMLVVSLAPVLFLTHLPALPFWAVLAFFPFFMVAMTGRMVPFQTLLTTVPQPQARGAFLSVNSSFQSLGSGCGAWLGGIILSTAADGSISGFGTVGWVATALAVAVGVGVARVAPADAAPAQARTE
jgi:DHA1 family inner membrane transport protein